jgi:hypothetical protein
MKINIKVGQKTLAAQSVSKIVPGVVKKCAIKGDTIKA